MREIFQNQKGLILPDGSVKPVGDQPQNVYITPDGREIVDPVVMASADLRKLQKEFAELKARVVIFDRMKDATITMKAIIENELCILSRRAGNLTEDEIRLRFRLQETVDLVNIIFGTDKKKNRNLM